MLNRFNAYFLFRYWLVAWYLLGIISTSYCQITSTFDTDPDGWTFSDQNLNPQAVTYNSTGGNPAGHVSSVIGSQVYYWTSPSKFNGNIAYFSYGQILRFDLQNPVPPTIHGLLGYDVAIRLPGGGELVYTLPGLPAVAPAWSSHSVQLDETAIWRVGSTAGPIATKDQIRQYLSGVASLRINGKYVSASSGASASLDNVRLEQRTVQTAPSISGFSTTSGKPGSSLTITGNDFGSTISSNAVYFGLIQGTITSASTTSLTVTVPVGAQYGPVTIINKATGLVKNSTQPFIPIFDDGGRIIPSSFDPVVNIPSTVQTGGLSMADIDGDGWNDIVVADASNLRIDVYRNLGLGGDLTASSFAAKVSFLTGGAGTNGAGLHIMDLDGDGILDMVTSIGRSPFVGSFATFRNISTPGNLAFEAPEYWDGKTDESPIYDIADIDGDGLPDLIGGEGSGGAGQNVWITQNMSSPGNIEFGYSLFYFSDTVDDAASGASVEDLDNDGKPEIILITGFGGQFSIIKNTSTPGIISFGVPFVISQSLNGAVVVADFNLDGKNDLAWKQGFINDDVHIRLNTNSGGLLAATDFATEVILNSELSNYGALSLGDVNGDGRIDIMATDATDFGVFENVFTGGAFSASSFASAYKRPGGAFYPTSIVAGDLNGDSKPDLIFSSTSASSPLHIIENKNVHAPKISLTTVSPLAGSVGSTVTITGDYFSTTTTDNRVYFGTIEASVLTATKTQLTVMVPSGAQYAPISVTRDRLTSIYHLPFNVTFSPGTNFDASSFAPPVAFNLASVYYEVMTGDLNNDGKPDVVATGGTFDAYAFRNTHSSGGISTSSLIADDTLDAFGFNHLPSLQDFDGDGKTDLIVHEGYFYQNLSTLSEIDFTNSPSFEFYSLNHSFGDFDHDGKMDFVGTRFSSNQIIVTTNKTTTGPFVFFNGGQADFASFDIGAMAVSFTKPAVFGYTAAIDFDNDGWTDIVATNSATDNFTVWRNNQTNRITATSFTNIGNIATGDNPGRIYSGDLDVDGKVDLMMYYGGGTSSGIISIFHNTSTTGSISFSRQDFTIGAGSNGGASAIGDLDGDGRPEIIVPSELAGVFRIFKNNTAPGVISAASFVASPTFAVTNPRAVAIGDINLDGRPEIIITSAPNSLLIYENLIPLPSMVVAIQPIAANVCDGSTATFTTGATGTNNIMYRWQYSPDGIVPFVDIVNGGGYSNAASTTLAVNTVGNFGGGKYRCKITGDFVTTIFTSNVDLVITSAPNPPGVSNIASCNSASVTITASGGANTLYRWYTTSTGGSPIPGEVNSSYTTPVLSTTTIFYVSLNNATCESARIPVTVTIGGLACTNQPPTIATVTSDITAGGTITINLNLLVSDPDNNIDINSFSIISPPTSGALAQIIAGILTLDYAGANFLGADQLTIQVCDLLGSCAQQQMIINVGDFNTEELNIYNGISPNGDLHNEQWIIQNIESLPDTKVNKVSIYNRWGDLIFEVENYDNDTRVFKGINKNGNEVSSGIYFYKIEFPAGKKSLTGYLTIKR